MDQILGTWIEFEIVESFTPKENKSKITTEIDRESGCVFYQ